MRRQAKRQEKNELLELLLEVIDFTLNLRVQQNKTTKELKLILNLFFIDVPYTLRTTKLYFCHGTETTH